MDRQWLTDGWSRELYRRTRTARWAAGPATGENAQQRVTGDPVTTQAGHSEAGRTPGVRGSAPWIVVAVVLVVALAGAGFIIWDRNFRRAGPANLGTSCGEVVHARRRLPFAAIGVRRVLLIGDSIMVQAGCAAASGLAGIGIETHLAAVGGSGLLSGAVDWQARTNELLETIKPDAVIAIFVGNYFAPQPDASGHTIAVDTPEFFAAWQQAAVALSAEVRAHGAAMYWVSPPPIVVLPRASTIANGYRMIPGTHFLNSGKALAGPKGIYVGDKKTCGKTTSVRVFDGVHLTEDGGRIYGETIAHDFSAQRGLLTAPKPC